MKKIQIILILITLISCNSLDNKNNNTKYISDNKKENTNEIISKDEDNSSNNDKKNKDNINKNTPNDENHNNDNNTSNDKNPDSEVKPSDNDNTNNDSHNTPNGNTNPDTPNGKDPESEVKPSDNDNTNNNHDTTPNGKTDLDTPNSKKPESEVKPSDNDSTNNNNHDTPNGNTNPDTPNGKNTDSEVKPSDNDSTNNDNNDTPNGNTNPDTPNGKNPDSEVKPSDNDNTNNNHDTPNGNSPDSNVNPNDDVNNNDNFSDLTNEEKVAYIFKNSSTTTNDVITQDTLNESGYTNPTSNSNSLKYTDDVSGHIKSKAIDKVNSSDINIDFETIKSKDVYKVNENKVHIFEVSPTLPIEEYRKYANVTIPKNVGRKINSDSELHSKLVLQAFLANPYSNEFRQKDKISNNNIFMYSNKDLDSMVNVEGILNLSFGVQKRFTNNFAKLTNTQIYINNIANSKDYIADIANYSNLIFYDKYRDNKQLKIISIGNGEIGLNNFWTPNESALNYQIMSPELQKMARSEVIFAKNIFSEDVIHDNNKNNFVNIYNTNEKKYYEPKYIVNSGEVYYDTKPLLQRANTVSTNGYIEYLNEKNQRDYRIGSSFSAPRIAKLAYDLKERYPFLTYTQIKQIILTTADRDDSGYLSNLTGWGVVNYNKAMKGISNLNAGLIEESKYFNGMYEKIYDKKGNIFFYLDIPNGTIAKWENDISSGLEGDGNSLDSDIIEYNAQFSKSYPEIKKYQYRIPRVIDSERNFYANVKQAGLRKAGKGQITLSGKQNYTTDTEILDGTLVLANDSLSRYLVSKNATLRISSKDLNGNVDIKNNIISSGKVTITDNTTIKEYIGLKDSNLTIVAGKTLNTDKFNSIGKLELYFTDPSILTKELIPIISKNGYNIKNTSLNNLFIDLEEIGNQRYKVKFKENSTLENLSESELRNIPSYDINRRKFFDNYYDRSFYYNFEDERELPTIKMANMITKYEDKKETEKEVFTDIYPSYIASIFDFNNTIKSNEVNSRIGNLDNKVKLSTFLSTNIFKNSNFNSFSQNVKGFSGKIFNIYGGYYNQNYTFDIDRKIKGDKILSNMYNIGIEKDFKISNTKLNTSFDFSFINTNLNRKINGDEVTSNFNSLLFNIGNILIHDINIWNNKLSLFATHNTSILKLNDIEEKSNKEELKDYITKVKSKTFVKTTLGIGANINSPITNNISLLNSFKYTNTINSNIELNTELLGIEYTSKGKSIEKHNFEYLLGLEYLINKESKLNMNMSYDSLNKLTVSMNMYWKW